MPKKVISANDNNTVRITGMVVMTPNIGRRTSYQKLIISNSHCGDDGLDERRELRISQRRHNHVIDDLIRCRHGAQAQTGRKRLRNQSVTSSLS